MADFDERSLSRNDALRWKWYSASPQTACMLGSKFDPNDQTITVKQWQSECNRLADEWMRKQGWDI